MAVDPTPLLSSSSSTLVLPGILGKGTPTFESTKLRQRAFYILVVLVSVNGTALVALFLLGRTYPTLIPTGILAMSFGLRHAVDADHIAAIDNVTRRLISERRQPLLVGLWFSLGHSSVVCLICTAAACGSGYLQELFDGALGQWGSLVSTIVSAGLLLAVGVANLFATLPAILASGTEHSHEHDHGGLFARCCPMLLRAIDTEWKMVLLGFVFGLGFETSSEIALLALAAMGPSQGIPAAATLVLPLLFAGGMSLVDTMDGMLMSFAYGAAAENPGGRMIYNLVLTIASSLIAIGIGMVELLGCVQSRLDVEGPFWDAVAYTNEHFELLGYVVIGFFALSMVAGMVVVSNQMSRRKNGQGEKPQRAGRCVWWAAGSLGALVLVGAVVGLLVRYVWSPPSAPFVPAICGEPSQPVADARSSVQWRANVLLAGQSNAVGTFALCPNHSIPHSSTLPPIFSNDTWNTLAPVGLGMPFGPELGMGMRLQQHGSSLKLAKVAVGGVPVTAFLPGMPLFAEAARVPLSRQCALVWVQGETDSEFEALANQYGSNFGQFLSALKNETGCVDMKVISALVRPSNWVPYVQIVNTALSKASDDVIDTSDLATMSDNLHYSGDSQISLGERLGARVLQLLKE